MKFLIIFAAGVAVSEACSCLPAGSPKEAFCSSDFVSHVKVTKKNDPNTCAGGIQNVKYTVQHIKVYRKPSSSYQLSNTIETASNSAACGVNLEVGKEYLLGDGVLHIGLCGTSTEWSNVPKKDKDALATYKC
ncbi:unnamed protein product [Nippostrongylus brasiliensis]|uniref:NTR domain-containing protein n=1 Tax=Nippostrongylus brasiliensis TaxID=27835 RepID=A0A0N4YI08_NIPBR|nr:unnamed protein product [Nippostrongylus brasiliensis]